MKDFIVNYGKYILYGIIILLDLIILLFRKNKTILTDKGVITDLITLIMDAEKRFKSGEEKLKFVIEKYKEMHPNFYDEIVDATKSTDKADKILTDYVEYILSSPQKKGK